MRVLIINNLSAGLGDGLVYDFLRAFVADGDEVVVRNTDGTTRIESMLDGAADFDCVVAAGGDSSVVSVCHALKDTGIPILPFPSGTANLLALNLELPEEPHALAKVLRQMKTVQVDLAELSVVSDGTSQTHGFAIIAGCGFDAAIMKDAVGLKARFGAAAYFLSALGNVTPTFAHYTLWLDGEKVELDGIALLAMNFAKIYKDLSITHENNAQDGLFEVGVLTAQNAFGLVPGLINALRDVTGQVPDRTDALKLFNARHIRVESDPPLPIQFDGDVILEATTPFEAWVLPGAANLIVP